MIYQMDRQYLLQVASGDKLVTIANGLNIKFHVSKSSDNKKKPNKAKIEIYNLSEQYQKLFETPYTKVVLSVGYLSVGMAILFSGEATIVGTEKRGTETITEIQLDTLFTTLNHKIINKTAPEGVSVKGVIENLIKSMDDKVSRVTFSGNNINRTFRDGYPLNGKPINILNDLAEAFELEWQIDGDVLYVEDRGTSYITDKSKAYVISEMTGMIERPYFDNVEKGRSKKDKLKKARKGIRVKILLNPVITAGSLVKMDYGEFQGVYKVESLTHTGEFYGNAWETDLVLATTVQGA